VVVSCEVGVAKPDPLIFQMCLTRLGVEPSRALFVDDRIENIEGAARLGLRTFHFIGADAVPRLVQSASA
jgi:HAD superfamily hydrolase (TIGR01509 family)